MLQPNNNVTLTANFTTTVAEFKKRAIEEYFAKHFRASFYVDTHKQIGEVTIQFEIPVPQWKQLDFFDKIGKG